MNWLWSAVNESFKEGTYNNLDAVQKLSGTIKWEFVLNSKYLK